MAPQDRHSEESKPFLNDDHQERPDHVPRKSHRSFIVASWMLTGLSWVITIYLLVLRSEVLILQTFPNYEQQETLCSGQSCITYFPTDLEAMRPAIEYEKRTFTGALAWDASTKRFFQNATAEELAYVGAPSEAIDDAWEALFVNEWTPLTEQEASPFPGIRRWGDEFMFEPSVYHSLHCLNEVRKHVDKDYYSQPEHAGATLDQEDWDRIHIDHCIDHLRQAVLCAGDLSPVGLYSWDGAPLGIGVGSEHTCRKWDPIKDWTNTRRREILGD